MRYTCFVNDSNKAALNKPLNSNMLYYSELTEWYTQNAFRSFSIKFPIQGTLFYKAGIQEYQVKAGEFLLACKQEHVKAYFQEPGLVKSICIDIHPCSISQAFTILSEKTDYDFDNYMAGYFRYPEFYENIYASENSVIGSKLIQAADMILHDDIDDIIDEEWYMDLSEKIILHEFGTFQALNGLSTIKPGTRKELLRRLMKAKDFMDENFLSSPDIATIAVHGNLSEFHFFRSFKQAFRITPYQYLMKKRLEYSLVLLLGTNYTLQEIAGKCGFADLFTYSKAFKRFFGKSPKYYCREEAPWPPKGGT